MNKTKKEHRLIIIEKRKQIKQQIDELMGDKVTDPTEEDLKLYDELQRQYASYGEIMNKFFSNDEKEEDEPKKEGPLY